MTPIDGPPLVSVVLPTRDRHERLAVAIDSVRRQTYPHLELIVVDDGSHQPVTVPADDPRVGLLRFPDSVGTAAARNSGFKAATGAYVCLLDDDDYFYPDKLEIQARYLSEHPDVDLIFSQVTVVEADGTRRTVPEAGYVFDPVDNLLAFNVIHPNAAMFRHEVTRRCAYDERLTRFTDSQFFMEAGLQYVVHYVPIPVAVWHHDDRPDRMTAADPLSSYESFRLVRERFESELHARPDVRREYDTMQAALELDLLRWRFLGLGGSTR
jgi:glycosyltransferase involved in cell wall biosynthesis